MHFSVCRCVFLFLSVLFGGCGNDSNVGRSAATSCTSGQVQLEVNDGFLRNLCGCTETAGTFAKAGTELTCTIVAGAYVSFNYLGTVQKHQIVSKGTPEFSPSPLSDPQVTAHTPIRYHGIALTIPGTYRFEDRFNSALSGQLVVQ